MLRRLWTVAERNGALWVTAAVFLVYLSTANLHGPLNGDAYAAAASSWRVATAGTVVLDDAAYPLQVPFQVATPSGDVTDRQPGVVLVAVPFYWVAARLGAGSFSTVPAAVAAAAVSAASIGVLCRLFGRLVDARTAMAAALVAAFATSSWSISADALWPHGPGQLWMALALTAASADRQLRTGLWLAAAVLTRPVCAVVALVLGLGSALRQRRFRPALVIGASSGLGVGALLLYNRLVFGALSVSGGYAPTFVDNLWQMSLGGYLLNLLGTLVSLSRGLLPYSPFLLLLLPGLRRAWRQAPAWARSGAVAAVLYLLVHMRMNRFSGGHGFYGYRYPLEALVLGSPMLLLAWKRWVAPRRARRTAFAALVALSVVLQWLGAAAWFSSSVDTDFWFGCGPCEAIATGGWAVVPAAAAAVGAVVVHLLRRQPLVRPEPARDRGGAAGSLAGAVAEVDAVASCRPARNESTPGDSARQPARS